MDKCAAFLYERIDARHRINTRSTRETHSINQALQVLQSSIKLQRISFSWAENTKSSYCKAIPGMSIIMNQYQSNSYQYSPWIPSVVTDHCVVNTHMYNIRQIVWHQDTPQHTRDPIYLHGLTLIPSYVITRPVKYGMKLYITSKSSTAAPLKFGYG